MFVFYEGDVQKAKDYSRRRSRSSTDDSLEKIQKGVADSKTDLEKTQKDVKTDLDKLNEQDNDVKKQLENLQAMVKKLLPKDEEGA